MSILYYSNFCEPSKRLLQVMAKTRSTLKIHYICVDRRYKDAKGQTMIEVESQRVVLPATVTRVPALLIMGTKQVLFGDAIYKYLTPEEERVNKTATNGQGEPECFSLATRMSDAYSFWDQDASALAATGNGGTRQMHHYVPVDFETSIPTPPDNYEPDKVGKNGSMTLDEYKAQRESDIKESVHRLAP